MEEKIGDGQEEMKSQVASLASQIDVNQEEMRARISAIQYKMKAMIKCSEEEMEVAIHAHYMWTELEETIKHRGEDVSAYVDQRTQGLCK
jgi:hypothetical protein